MKVITLVTALLALAVVAVDLMPVMAQQQPNFMYQTDVGRREQGAIRDKQALEGRWNAAWCSRDWMLSRSKCQYCSSLKRQMRDLHQRMTGVFANARVQTQWSEAERRWYRQMEGGHRMKWGQYEKVYNDMARRCSGM